MGEMTLTDFRSDLTSAISRGTISTTLLDRWINASLREFGHAIKFRELEKTTDVTPVQGTNVVALPADFRSWHEEGLWIISPTDRVGRVRRESRKQYLMNADLDVTTNQGIFTYYHVYGLNLYLRPFADGTVTTLRAHYWAKVVKFTGVNDVSQFDEDWDDIIFTGALYRGYRHFGEHDRYINVRNDFIGMIRSRVMDEDLEEFPEGGISAVGPDDDELSVQS